MFPVSIETIQQMSGHNSPYWHKSAVYATSRTS
jgi:hypothetical protein